jgi:hypothetical protein
MPWSERFSYYGADHNERFDSYEKLVDFYHAGEHLSKAAEALFGKNSTEGKHWYTKYRAILQEQDDGVKALRRSIDYYRARPPAQPKQPQGLGDGTDVLPTQQTSDVRWSRQGGQRILNFRCYVKSGLWKEFWDTYRQLRWSA